MTSTILLRIPGAPQGSRGSLGARQDCINSPWAPQVPPGTPRISVVNVSYPGAPQVPFGPLWGSFLELLVVHRTFLGGSQVSCAPLATLVCVLDPRGSSRARGTLAGYSRAREVLGLEGRQISWLARGERIIGNKCKHSITRTSVCAFPSQCLLRFEICSNDVNASFYMDNVKSNNLRGRDPRDRNPQGTRCSGAGVLIEPQGFGVCSSRSLALMIIDHYAIASAHDSCSVAMIANHDVCVRTRTSARAQLNFCRTPSVFVFVSIACLYVSILDLVFVCARFFRPSVCVPLSVWLGCGRRGFPACYLCSVPPASLAACVMLCFSLCMFAFCSLPPLLLLLLSMLCLSVCLSVFVSSCQPGCLFISVSIRLPVCLSVHL